MGRGMRPPCVTKWEGKLCLCDDKNAAFVQVDHLLQLYTTIEYSGTSPYGHLTSKVTSPLRSPFRSPK